MLDRREHRRDRSGARETQGRALGSHRDELNEFRLAWQRTRDARPGLHRAVLEGERREMRETRRMPRQMRAQNRWLLVLAERLQERLKKAGGSCAGVCFPFPVSASLVVWTCEGDGR